MLRVTPIYGSRWSPEGQAEEPSCTLVEYGECRVLLNVGWWSSSSSAASNNNSNASAVDFPQLPPHDCLLLTDGTLQCMGGLPLYYEQMKQQQEEAKKKKQAKPPPTTSSSLIPGSVSKNDEPDDGDDDEAPLPMIYATFPVVKMGQMTLYDYHANLCSDGARPPFTLNQMDEAVGAIQSIKYSQQIHVTPTITNMTNKSNVQEQRPTVAITAHRAGHSVGAAFFVLQRLQDETTVVLTKTYHIAKELHLDSSTLLKYATTPDVLVTYPGGPALHQFKALATSQKNKDKSSSNKRSKSSPPPLAPQLVTQLERQFTESIMAVLRRNGHVLLPTDAAGRALELVFLLNQYWERHRFQAAYNLVWLGPMVTNTAAFAKSQTEWMAERLMNETSSTGDDGGGKSKNDIGGGFHLLKTIQFCSTTAQVKQLLQQNPTCVLATGVSLEHGSARDVLLELADNPDNAIIFTDSSQAYLRKGTTAPTTTLASNNKDAMEVEDVKSSTAEEKENKNAATTDIGDGSLMKQESNNDDEDNEHKSKQEGGEEEPDENDDGTNNNNNTGTILSKNQISRWTTAAQLLLAWGKAKRLDQEMEDSVFVDVAVPRRLPLAGAELQEFYQAEAQAKRIQQQQAAQRAMLREVELAKGQLRLGEDEEQQQVQGQQGQSLRKQTGNKTAPKAVSSTRPRKKSRFDQTLFLKYSKPIHLAYEVREDAVGIGQKASIAKFGIGESIGRSGEVLEDDYGIQADQSHFTDIVSGVDPSKFGTSGRVGEDVLRRGFGYAGGSAGNKNPNTASSGGAARVSEDEGGDGEGGDGEGSSDFNDQELEAVDLSEGNGIIRGRNGRPPMKVSTVIRRIEVLAEIYYIPLEGRVDARAARQSVRALQPRQVIVMGGPCTPSDEPMPDFLVDEVAQLAEAVKSFSSSKAEGDQRTVVMTPSDGETAKLNVGHAAYAVRLIDTPYEISRDPTAAAPEPVEPYEVKLGACTVSLLDSVATGQKSRLDGSLVLAPRQNASGARCGKDSIYLSAGDVLLTDLRAELIAQGMKADYSARQMVVNGKIIVRKDQTTGRMQVEGPLCEDFWTVRQVVCRQYVVL